MAADISTETKVEFPRMASCIGLMQTQYILLTMLAARCRSPSSLKPFSLAMSVRDEAHRSCGPRWQDSENYDVKGDFLPSKCLFGNGVCFPTFRSMYFNPWKVPTRPTFGVKLQWDERGHEINKVLTLVTQTFNSARHCLDYEFIRKNPDFCQLVTYIDTADHDWLDFDTPDKNKLDLF